METSFGMTTISTYFLSGEGVLRRTSDRMVEAAVQAAATSVFISVVYFASSIFIFIGVYWNVSSCFWMSPFDTLICSFRDFELTFGTLSKSFLTIPLCSDFCGFVIFVFLNQYRKLFLNKLCTNLCVFAIIVSLQRTFLYI